MLRKEEKTSVIEANRLHEHDTGSPEVQIAILTQRINELTEHIKVHQKDLPPWSSEDGRSQKKPSELPPEEGYRTLPCDHR